MPHAHRSQKSPAACPLFVALLVLALLGFFGASARSARAENPFLVAPEKGEASAEFKGTEWGDDVPEKERPLSARVVTTLLAKLPFGAAYKIEFKDIRSRAAQPRSIPTRYFLATETELWAIRDENPAETVERWKTQKKPPALPPEDLFGISRGTRIVSPSKLSTTLLTAADDLFTYKWSHNSGHFATLVFRRGVGLVEISQGRGARADGYRLKRAVDKK